MALLAAVALGPGCNRSHRVGGSDATGPDAGSGPDATQTDAGSATDRHPCFELSRAECDAMPRWQCGFQNTDEQWGCPATQHDQCFPTRRFEGDVHRRLTDCEIEKPCPTGSRYCYIGSCSSGEAPGAGEPQQVDSRVLEACLFELATVDGRDVYDWYADWAVRCIPPDADPASYGCTLIEVLPGE